ncbi:vascular endothelial growth factor receptor 2 isoform X2 [Hypomesus transpacificus]|uniref:vascular endothelial growth factor receptor 2 isoform X2 n=1 Tax=Hypomesus transpacificus TaxID=137520 RepID=UPI001F07A6FC|nr:vascular endothelial growth factor receptor 2 isoform X2 [Hypomesus transpacificus]
MAKAVFVIYLVGTVFGISRMTALELRFMSEPPMLSPPERVHRINTSDTLELTCSGRQVLEWNVPYNMSRAGSHLSTVDCRGSGLFCTRLRISTATVNETGEYRCSYTGLVPEEAKTSAAVYVYVQDYKVPFLPSDKEYEVVFIREGEQVVIPCRGSMEDLNVTLHTYPKKELSPNGKDCLWDSRTGFTVPSHLISYAGVVFCQTHIHNDTFKSPLYIVAVVGYKIYDLTLTPAHERLSAGERLLLNCTARTELNVGIDFKWSHSQIQAWRNGSVPYYTLSHKKKLWNSLELSNTLVVENVTVNQSGTYNCTASSGQMVLTSSATVVVYEKPFIEMEKQWVKVLEVNVGEQTARIPVKYLAYPEPNVRWFKNGQAIRRDEYRMKPARDGLTIYQVVEQDAGNYTVVLTNKITREESRRSFQLLVYVPPHILEKDVAVDTDVYMYGSSPTLRCTARGIPTPAAILWQWMPKEDCPSAFQSGGVISELSLAECTNWRDISNSTRQNLGHDITSDFDQSHKAVSSLKIRRAEENALYRCVASNKLGKDQRNIFFHVTRGLELSVSPSPEPIEQDQVVLRCKADPLLYRNLAWFRLANVSETEPHLAVQPCRTLALPARPLPARPLPQALPQALLAGLGDTNVSLELPLANVSRRDEGLYVCQLESIKTGEKTCLLRHLTLKALEVSRILTNLTEQRVNVSATTTLECQVTGTPTPTVVWSKDNHSLVEGSGVVLGRLNRTLTIQRVKREDGGLYTCTACNSQGCDTAQAYLLTQGADEKTNVELIVPIGSVVIAMFFWLLIVFVIRSRKRPSGGDLKTGYLSIILDSEDMPTDENCERLTYDASKWEFPRDRLKLGDPLGRGAFGQVVEAAAFGIEKNATCTTVAVKMLKEGATSSEYRALMSELKILIHIGHHLNVVNLLGACTKPGGPLMVIVEYCKNGNLSSYLKSKRGEYSPYKRRRLCTDQQWLRVEGALAEGGLAEGYLAEGDLGLGTSAQLDICTGTAVGSKGGTKGTRPPQDEESSDYDHLTMEDLISYSFQVAKGMDFLSSRKCIHRDLAARNILLSESNVVKICDFGLARDVYKDPDYVRKGDARLPLKWMAPETIFDRVYTTQSDVWSFGVLLWEIFSLGASPYPGVGIDEAFCRRLREGTRMRAPDYATAEIYQTMLSCWLDRPSDRPTFSELVQHLGLLLQASALQGGKDYIPLTDGELQGSLTSDPSRRYVKSLRDATLDPQVHYDNAPPLGLSQQSDRCSRPLSVKIFEDIPVSHGVVMEGLTDSGVGLSQDEMKVLGHQPQRTLSQLLRCKSKESLESESSNQTSGYQSGYHSDDADAPIYANEEMILKHHMQKKPTPTKTKFTVEVRYSTPPV